MVASHGRMDDGVDRIPGGGIFEYLLSHKIFIETAVLVIDLGPQQFYELSFHFRVSRHQVFRPIIRVINRNTQQGKNAGTIGLAASDSPRDSYLPSCHFLFSLIFALTVTQIL